MSSAGSMSSSGGSAPSARSSVSVVSSPSPSPTTKMSVSPTSSAARRAVSRNGPTVNMIFAPESVS